MSNLENDLRQQILNLETKLAASGERERQLNEMIRYYKGRIEGLIHAANKEGKIVHVFAQGTEQPISGNNDGKFRTAKRRFASLYHPDTIKYAGVERIVREELFKEFWSELEKIESEA